MRTSQYFKRKRSSSPSRSALGTHRRIIKEEEDQSQCLFRDPLFCFYFRAFARLYHQLLLLKPSLIQESVADDPWKVLVAVTLLNKTSGKAAIPVFWDIMARYPTPCVFATANETDLTTLIRPLGLQSVRAKRLIRLSKTYLEAPPALDCLYKSSAHTITPVGDHDSPTILRQDGPSIPQSPTKRQRYPPTPVSHFPGTGAYALDSYRIFCTSGSEPDAWKDVMPTDKELVKFLKWKWAFKERKLWKPGTGVTGNIDIEDLEQLIEELSDLQIADRPPGRKIHL